MNNCRVPINLAYLASAYIIASIYYLVRSRSFGTPFNDSLTEAQKQIKKESADRRRKAFVVGLALAAAALYYLKPFERCT